MSLLITKIKEEMKKSESTGNYENLYRYAYSDDFITRYNFMKMLLLKNCNLSIEELYDDDITRYFYRYDDDSNITYTMPYALVNDLFHSAMFKDEKIYGQIRRFIVENYIKKPIEKKENAKITL